MARPPLNRFSGGSNIRATGPASRLDLTARGGAASIGTPTLTGSLDRLTGLTIDTTPGLNFDPNIAHIPDGVLDGLIAETAPLMLMPMRMEYRFVKAADKLSIVDESPLLKDRKRLLASVSRNNLRQRIGVEAELTLLRNENAAKPKLRQAKPRTQELWVRWYPDSDFSRKGIAPVSTEENTALAIFHANAGGGNWWALSTVEATEAWETLAAELGPARALHLLRPDAPEKDDEPDLGKITALPRKVVLFAQLGGALTELGEGGVIPANTATRSEVSYTQEALEAGGWLASFETAVSNGMGVKITDAAMISLAEKADWVIAVGLHSSDAREEVAALLADRIAEGSFGFLPQDTPTNNTTGERTPYRGWRDDAQRFLVDATGLERGVLDSPKQTAAALLAEALDIPDTEIARALGAGDTSFEDASAMLRVIGPALLDGAFDGKTAYEGVDENEMIDILAASVAARGALPNLMLGSNAYGVLPVTLTSEMKIDTAHGFDEAEAKVLSRLSVIGNIITYVNATRSKTIVPVLDPDKPDETPARFEQILQAGRVSRRVELFDEEEGVLKALGCAYVSGPKAETRPESYLNALRSTAPDKLPDPNKNDHAWPLLYRLARLTMTRNIFRVLQKTDSLAAFGRVDTLLDFETMADSNQVKALSTFNTLAGELGLTIGAGADRRPGRARPGRVNGKTVIFAQGLFTSFDRGLAHLQTIAARTDGMAALETLMMEVFDLFQHRADAWLTGLAYARLKRRRQAGGAGLRAGYFAMLSGFRRAGTGAKDDGYIQAPSTAQATTAAILRSAHRRHRDGGAFNLDLSSARVRRAMGLMDHLRAGATLAAGLGLRAERLLRERDKNASHLIPALRSRFPIENLSAPDPANANTTKTGPSGAPMLDGLALLDAPIGRIPATARTDVAAVKAQLADDLDGVSDLILAEAVHHRALGSTEAANAWMQVLSGGTVPDRPIFLRTQRPMQASSHRVTLVMPAARAPNPSTNASARRYAAPGLAALADQIAGADGNATLTLHATLVDDPTKSIALPLGSQTDLGMDPIDLMIGGKSELLMRAQVHFASLWRAAAPETAPLGALAPSTRPAQMAAVELALEGGAGLTAASLLAKLKPLRAAIGQGRAMEPSDLNAAAKADKGMLSEADESASLFHGIVDLKERATALAKAMEREHTRARSAGRTLRPRLLSLGRLLDLDPELPTTSALWRAAKKDLARFQATLMRASGFGLPEVLRDNGLTDHLANPDLLISQLRLVDELQAKALALRALLTPAASAPIGELRGAVKALSAAISGSLDGAALPIFAQYACATAALQPSVDAGVRLPAGLEDLKEWAEVRRHIGGLGRALTTADFLKNYAVQPDATLTPADSDQSEDRRGDDEAPKAMLFGRFLADRVPAGNATPMAGVVIDEWAEHRPSTMQPAALAMNYNTPDAQAPNAVLLCVPPDKSWKSWSDQRAASMVAEVIKQMQARALTSDQRAAATTLSQDSNRVPFKRENNKPIARIPERELRVWHGGLDASTTGMFTLKSSVALREGLGINGAGLSLADGFIGRRN